MSRDVFNAYGIACDPALEEWIGSERGKCLVVGTGWTLWQDMEAAGFEKGEWKQPFGIVAVNRAVQDLPCFVNHGFSNHARMLRLWHGGRDEVHARKDRLHPGTTVLHSIRGGHDGIVWPWSGCGTSSLCAVLTAITLGYEEVLVCGVPMDKGPHYYDPPWHKTNFANNHNDRHWQDCARRVFNGRVRVMSGRLASL